jgi:uncharacterized membrane protein (UPF0182 family)
VVLEGRILWVQDAFTTTSKYPYAQRADTSRLLGGSGLNGGGFNYVRNSVKVVTDAYNGTLTYYVVDENDPIARAYQKAFPQLFQPGDRMPDDLRAHLRYPEDLFRVQTNMLGLYHITRAADFYSKADAWEVARDPGSGELGQSDSSAASTPAAPAAGASGAAANPAVGTPGRKMDPYYLLTKLPDATKEDFLILQPFVPVNKDILSAFVVAKSDPDDYGALEVYQMPRDLSVRGPRQVNAIIQANEDISRLFTLLNARGSGSKVIQGNLLVVPIEQSLLYIRPLYVQSENQPLPEFRKVLVVFGDRAVAADTLRDALTSLFGAAPPTLEQGGGTSTTPPPTTGATPPPTAGGNGPAVSSDVQGLLDQAAKAFDAADAALKAGDLAEFQKQVKAAQGFIAQARQKAAAPAAPAPTTTTTTTAPVASA